MCCTFTASEMSDTRIYVGEAQRKGKLVHVLAYQNTAAAKGPNAMVLPFPTHSEMGPDNVIDTRKFKGFLKQICDATRYVTKGARRGSMMLGSRGFDSDSLAEVFDVGSYTVILADNVFQIPEALSRVAADKRPRVSSDFLIGYNELYKDQPIAVCCWNGSIEAEPLMWWYEPSDPDHLFIPTMDAHDGGAPRVGTPVQYDHLISVGSTTGNSGNRVVYSDARDIPKDVQELLPLHVHGGRMPETAPNGDCLVKTSLLHSTRESLFRGGSEPVTMVHTAAFRGKQIATALSGWY